MALRSAILLFCVLSLAAEEILASVFSSRLIHRFSDEGRALIKTPTSSDSLPEKRSLEYHRLLASSDFRRQRMNLGAKFQSLVPSEGSKTISSGNDFGWLHYTWIDIGTPSVSFLVALDSGSDLLWIPCNCVQCAPLTSSYYSSLATKDLNEYNPSSSSSSKVLLCSHKLCESASDCESPNEQCPYNANYASDNTSSSGPLVEDILHLTYNTNNRSMNSSSSSVRARVVIGCGKKQSGEFLNGVAPDGLMGLGLGEISVPSFLSKAGLMRNSFSLCFDEEDSGRIYFGDMGPSMQQSTHFLPFNNEYVAYIVGVEACCIGNSCLKQTSFRTLIDSGQSFTSLPEDIYREVAAEIDRHVNATIKRVKGGPWDYCYETSVEPKVPAIKLKFPYNNTFVIHKPLFEVQQSEGLFLFCLPISSSGQEGRGTIGQNYMREYRMVFDRENMKLGWSASKCQEDKIAPPQASPGSTSSPNPLPTEEQQSRSHAVSPAIAGKTPSKPSSSSSSSSCSFSSMMTLFNSLLLLLWVV